MRTMTTLIASLLLPSSALATEACFQPEGVSGTLHLNGDAEIDSGEIQVTADLNSQLGAVWFDDQVSTASDIHAYFVANISGTGGGGDGVALVMQSQEPTPIGAAGGGLGYEGISPSVVVEFDTYPNAGDPDDNHVGVTLGGDPTVHSATYTPSWSLEGSHTHVWVDYHSGSLEVRVAPTDTRPLDAQMTVSVDLASELGSDFWVGLTGATGGAKSRHAFPVVTFVEGALADADSNNIPDGCEDSDGDGILNAREIRDHDLHGDVDGDGIDAVDDLDSDGDGIDDEDEYSVDSPIDADEDGIPNYLDLDSDNDGITDADELADYTEFAVAVGAMPWVNLDSDGDGVLDSEEGRVDTDVDDIPDYLDLDSDGGGTPDAEDLDRLDPLDDDRDNDGLTNGQEATAGTDPANSDTDGDSVLDGADPCPLSAPDDTDGDGVCEDVDVCTGNDTTGDSDGDGTCDDIDPCVGDDSTGDADGDGFCADQDCDDESYDFYPGAPELCDGLDNDCDGTLPADEADRDGDGVSGCADCDDLDPANYPGATEACDGQDNNCDGLLPADEVDADGDASMGCEGDCDDDDDQLRHYWPEICGDGIDNDCSGTVDDGCVSESDFGTCSTAGNQGFGASLLLPLAFLLLRRRRE